MSTRILRGTPRHHFYWTLLQLWGVALLGVAAVTLGLAASAGATGPAGGTSVPNSAVPLAPFTANQPFDSGQIIKVAIPANSVLTVSTKKLNIVECAAPSGVIPTQTSACDGLTNAIDTVFPAADGSVSYSNYAVYALPDSFSLGELPGGPACGETAATECILYVGYDSTDFTQPHFWSQPFFIAPNATDTGSPPGDGSAPPAAVLPDATKSTVVGPAASPVADGADQATVTVTLLDSSSLPVANKTVTLKPQPGSSATITGPTPATTGADGKTAFTVTDSAAEALTLTATDVTDTPNVTLPLATVTFQKPTTDPTHSTVVANPTSVPNSGNSTTITVTLRDQAAGAHPLANHTVTLSQSGQATITPVSASGVTDGSGVATFTATDSKVEIVTFTAKDSTDGTTLTNTPAVTFGTFVVSDAQSTVTVPSSAAVGSFGTTAVVTLRTGTDMPVANSSVTLAATSTSGQASVTNSPTTTNAQGQASFTVIDSVAEDVKLTAIDTTDGNLQLSSQPTVTFVLPSPSATVSTVTAGTPTAPADGQTPVPITVQLVDQFNEPLSGKTISVQGSPTGNVQVHPIAVAGGVSPGVTDSTGVAHFEANDTSAEVVTFTATDTTDNLVLTHTATATFTVGQVSPSSLGTTVTVDPANPPADGTSASTVTVTLADLFSNPVAGKTVSLTALNGSSKITNVSPTTNQAGQAAFSVTDSTAEVVTYQATDASDNNEVLTAQGVVTFGHPPSPPPAPSFCDVLASPSSVPADGAQTSTVNAVLADADGDPVSGKTVTLTASGGASKITAINGTSDNLGTASFAVSDAKAESVTYTVHDTTDSVDLTGTTATVTFTAAASSTTTSSTTTTTSPSGTTTSTSAPGSTTAASGTTTAASGTTGNTGSGSANSVSTGSSLAVTGPSALLPGLIGCGALFLGVGSIGRRQINRRKSSEI